MGQLDGKVALVTGSSRGIGKAIAIALAREGANLVLAARDAKDLQATKSAVVTLGVKAESIPTDVTSEEQVESLFSKAMKKFGRLDILINNAGILGGGPIDQLSTDIFDKVIATNLRGPFLCTRAAFRIMKAQKSGRIINIGSLSALRVRAGNAPYSSAKFGLLGLTHVTALEGREFGIKCGILHPGNVSSEIGNKDDGEPKQTVEEMAAAAVYMACQPPHVNVLELVQLPSDQPFIGRG
jgi:NAD(P)-dependent dehydrogenase (short-subunit alcohol dehydrogenase family)